MAKTSKEYWLQRSNDIFDRLDKSDDKIKAEMLDYYKQALDNINDKIYKFYERYGKDNKLDYAEALKTIRATDMSDYVKRANEYRKGLNKDAEALKRLNAQYTSAKINRLELLKLELEFEMLQASNSQEQAFTDYMRRQSEYIYEAAVAGKAIAHLNNREIDAIVKSEWSGANYSQRLWRNADVMVNKLKDALVGAAIRGDNPRVTANRLAKQLGASKYVTERLVRTESTAMANASIAKRYKDAGFKSYEFAAVMDRRTSTICRELNGTVHKLSNFQAGENAPAMHPNCRSRIVPSDEDLQRYDKYLEDTSTDKTHRPEYEDVDKIIVKDENHRKLDYNGEPNSVVMLELKADKPEQKRYYGGEGKPIKDIDYTDHGYPSKHVIPHAHDWTDGKRQGGGGRLLNEDER